MKYLLILLFFCHQSAFTQITKAIRVIDGDTFVIESGDKVRLIGINAPEISDIAGIEAKEHLSGLIEGKTILLKPDHRSNERDRYSRLLKYVYIDSTDINELMLEDGYAVAYLKFKFDKPEEYKKAQIQAQTRSVGMWANPNLRLSKVLLKPKSESSSAGRTLYLNKRIILIAFLTIILLGLGLHYRFKP